MKKFMNSAAMLICGVLALFFHHSLLASDSRDKPNVVTTVSPITNMVQNIGGTHIRVTGLVPGGVDSHTFEPIPSDIKTLQAADLIVMNGLDLELPT